MQGKRRGNQFFRILKRAIILIVGFILIFSNFKIPQSLASRQGLGERDTAMEELQNIKESEAVYKSQLSDLLEKSLAIENKFQLVSGRYLKIKSAADKAGRKILQNKIMAENMRMERKKIISDLYIITDDPLYFVLSFMDTDKFMSRLHGKDENSIVIGEKIKKVVEINSFLRDLSDEQKILEVKEKSYSDQAEKFAREAQAIQEEITKKEVKLSGITDKKSKLEKYLIGLDKLSSNSTRGFVSWNSSFGPFFEIVGGGTEHGLGLSQYGAKGMADQGKNYHEILSHYYQKTKIEKIKNNPKVKIGIVLGGKGGSLQVVNGSYKIHGFTVGEGKKIFVSPKSIRIYDGEKEIAKFLNSGHEQILPSVSASQIKVNYKSSYFNKYFGEIRLIKSGSSLITINVLPMEEYLKGVVVAEVPYTWEMEAIKAQAVAARSYTVRHLGSKNLYDMDDSTAYQVYIGAAHRMRSNLGVSETRGEVVTYAGKIIPTYYFSTSGGWTENNENIWGGKPLPYLRGVESPWEEDSPWWTWYTKKYSRVEISSLLAPLSCGKIKKIAIKSRGISGRVLAIKIIGTRGVRIISGPHFKDLINAPLGPDDEMMRSTLFGIRSIQNTNK